LNRALRIVILGTLIQDLYLGPIVLYFTQPSLILKGLDLAE